MRVANIADIVARELSADTDDGEISGVCDMRSCGELDTTQMDILCDMVKSRLDKSLS